MNTIIHMKHAMGDVEYLRDVQDAEYKRRLVAKNLALVICAEISKHFTVSQWDAWVDASPDDEYEFLAYAEAEAVYIVTELFDAEQVEQTAEAVQVTEWLGVDPLVDPAPLSDYDVYLATEKAYAHDPSIENRAARMKAWKKVHPTASPYNLSEGK